MLIYTEYKTGCESATDTC